MDLHLSGQRALVTGSTQGIGYAIAAALAGEGVEVVLHGRDPHRVDAAVARLRSAMPSAAVHGAAADVSDAAQISAMLDTVGEVDILVNNVGVFELEAFSDLSDDAWLHTFAMNVMSGVRMSRRLMPGMLHRGRGRVIFIGSESGVDVPADMIHYGVSKAGMIALGNGLAKLTRGTEVTVNTILGGPTYSAGVASSVEGIAQAQSMPVEDLKAAIIAGRPTSLLERFIDPREIAHLALYLASPLSSATNGAALRADGGVLTTAL